MLDVRKLRMLSALERLGTIAAVAEELHLTAPGVSMQLSGLERQLGVPLTERQGRGLALTPAGRVLAAHGRAVYGYCRAMLGDGERAADVLQKTFVQAFEGFPRFQRRSSLRGWLFAIARHRCSRF